ncbi:hypothetical protein, partial [Actinoalloteichus spitiensis]|uniref:hypothetical protein n=1 Tax=Actinoalloteichus spitiensis TaxID=252394 RepID=UPI000475136E
MPHARLVVAHQPGVRVRGDGGLAVDGGSALLVAVPAVATLTALAAGTPVPTAALAVRSERRVPAARPPGTRRAPAP